MEFFDSDTDEDLMQFAILYRLRALKKKRTMERRYWVREKNKHRETTGEFQKIVKQSLDADEDQFYKYFRMTKVQFEGIHEMIKDGIKKEDTAFRKSIGTKERLSVFLRFLVSGNSFHTIGDDYQMGYSTVRTIVMGVSEAILQHMGPKVMPRPTVELWRKVAEDFKTKWDFPNCIGALDSKLINMNYPIKGSAKFWKYKNQRTIALLALVDAELKFIIVDVGAYGRNSDGGILENSIIGRQLERKELNIPPDQPLKPGDESLPFVIVGNDAFPLKTYLMSPYSEQHLLRSELNKIFNCRLSCARKVVDNAIAILQSRWRLFQAPINVRLNTLDKVVQAACCLHNYLGPYFEPIEDDIAADLSNTATALIKSDSLRQNSTLNAFYIRNQFTQYFASAEGSVPWQVEMVRENGNSQNNN